LGNLISYTSPVGAVATFTYNGNGQALLASNALGGARINTYYTNGTLATYTDADVGMSQFEYDGLLRLTNVLFPNTTTVSYAYDANDNVTKVRDAHGHTTTYTYDVNDRLVSVGDTLTGMGLELAYDAAGRLVNVTRSNGVNAVYTYDAAGRQIRRQEGGIIDLQYTYDDADRLVEVDLTAPLDPAGLLTNATRSFTYDAASEVSSAGYEYDQLGRVTNLLGTALIWDDAERLRQIGGVNLNYRGHSPLAMRDDGGAATNYHHNYAIRGRPIVAEQDLASTQFQRYYVWTPGGTLLYGIDIQNGQIFYYHFDITGSALALTDTGGGVTDSYAYSAFGEILGRTGTNPQPFTFVGRFGVRVESAMMRIADLGCGGVGTEA